MKITVLCENLVNAPIPHGLIGEHGISFLIEDDYTMLFDTGQGAGIINNMEKFGKDIDAIDRIILSHGHHDHVAGLFKVLEKRRERISVYANSEVFINKIVYIDTPNGGIEIPYHFPLQKEQYEDEGADFQFINGFYKVEEKITAISDIERPEDWKGWDIRLKQKEDGNIIDDPFNDDLSLLIETESGPVVLIGCAHAGIVEILDDISIKSGHKEFHAIIGGMHLDTAPLEYRRKAMASFKKYKAKIIGLSHCTGFNASCCIAANFENEVRQASVGNMFEF